MIFTKMQCVGNDFLILNCFNDIINIENDLPVKVCNRHFGIGADGLALILYSDDADIKVDFYNADGIKDVCNTNLLRCIVKYALENKIVDKSLISVDTCSGIKYVEISDNEKLIVNIGEPVFTPQLIPVDYTGDEFMEKVISIGSEDYVLCSVSVGSKPCTVIFVDGTDELNDFEINKVAPFIENHNIFPNGTNVIISNIVDRNTMQVRCWQKDIGETIGCDFGATAAFVIAELMGKVDNEVLCELHGGDLNLQISDDNFAYTSAKAENVFEINW